MMHANDVGLAFRAFDKDGNQVTGSKSIDAVYYELYSLHTGSAVTGFGGDDPRVKKQDTKFTMGDIGSVQLNKTPEPKK